MAKLTAQVFSPIATQFFATKGTALRQKLQKEILTLEKKLQRERQFNRQVEMNDKLRQLKWELEMMV